MPANNIQYPGKTREFHNHHFDSTVWNDFIFSDGDIVIGTWGKSGTTWTQQIAANYCSAQKTMPAMKPRRAANWAMNAPVGY